LPHKSLNEKGSTRSRNQVLYWYWIKSHGKETTELIISIIHQVRGNQSSIDDFATDFFKIFVVVIPESELHELLNMLILELVLSPDERVEPGGGHERRSDGLDLFNIPARKVLCKDDICCRL
jgi:hypothetical protein